MAGLQRGARGELAAWVPNFLANLHAHREDEPRSLRDSSAINSLLFL